MTSERWARIKDIFADALDLAESSRAPFLATACGSDGELRSEVDRLLAQAGGTLKSPAAGILTHAPSLSTGEMLAHYRVESKLGQGGMGSVYKAFDTRLQRQVALKILPPSQVAGPEQKERLVSEARAASALNHPNIVTVYEIGAGDGVDFIAMEFVDGRSLSELIPPTGLPVKRAIELAIEIAGALAQAHAAGVVHRDLKPANVMVNAQGRVKLLDFGLAQRVRFNEDEAATVTAQGEIAGTPAYMSPEQAEGQKADERSDLFSFGAVLYEMLTGQRPFAGSSATSIMASVLRDEPPPLANVPVELSKLVGRCLRKDRSRRFQHMGDVRILLEDLIQEVVPPRPAPPKPTEKRVVRWRIPAIVLALLTVLGVGAAFLIRRPPHYPEPVSDAALVKPPSQDKDLGLVQDKDAEPVRDPMRVVPLTTYPGMVRDPSFSPDGKQVAFAWNGGNRANTSIYVKVADSGAPPLRLTTGNSKDVAATWSPHGTRVAFRRLTGSPGIYMVPPLGGTETRVAESGPLGQETLAQMSWTPDGNWLAAPERSPNGATQIFLFPLHQGEKHQMTWNASGTDQVPAISPDGKYLAYASCTYVYPCDIYVVELDSKRYPLSRQATRLTHQGSYIRGLAWMRDSRHLVYAAGQEATMDTYLWRVALFPPAPPERLDIAGSQVRHPTVARVGDRLAFTRFNRDADIWQYTLDADPKPFLSSTVFQYDPAFSPDGKKIAYCSKVSGLLEIWTVNPDGSKPVQLTDHVGRAQSSPAWSPDGRWIAFDSQSADGHSAVFVVDSLGGSPRRVTSPGYEAFAPSWSRDGKAIYFGRTGEPTVDIWRIPAAGGECVRITDRGGFYSTESTDGKLFYYTKEVSTSLAGYRTPVFVKPLSGGPERELLSNVEWYGFTVVSDGIYSLAHSGDGAYAIEFYDFATRTTRKLAAIHQVPFHRMTISPDRKTILFGTLRSLDWELALIENFR